MKKNEHATAEKILRAAKDVFMAKGFNGSSINDIAFEAKIHKSLIYHHFGNKEGLCKAVKTSLLQSHTGKDITEIDFPVNSFKEFLKSVVTLRFEFYDKNPSIVRLISWQRLEKEKDKIKGVTTNKLNTFVPQIKEFQRRGEVRSELDPEMVSYLIMTTASLPFMEKPDFFQGKGKEEKKQKFLDMILEGLYLSFATQKIV